MVGPRAQVRALQWIPRVEAVVAVGAHDEARHVLPELRELVRERVELSAVALHVDEADEVAHQRRLQPAVAPARVHVHLVPREAVLGVDLAVLEVGEHRLGPLLAREVRVRARDEGVPLAVLELALPVLQPNPRVVKGLQPPLVAVDGRAVRGVVLPRPRVLEAAVVAPRGALAQLAAAALDVPFVAPDG